MNNRFLLDQAGKQVALHEADSEMPHSGSNRMNY